MDVKIARVAYGYNTALTEMGQPAYFFDCLVIRDGQTLVDKCARFDTPEETLAAVEEVIPLIPALEEATSEDWEG